MFLDLLKKLDLEGPQSGVACASGFMERPGGPAIASSNPADGSMLGVVRTATRQDYDICIRESRETFQKWRMLPAPQRGEYVRRIGNALRAAKSDLGLLVTLEAGKIRSEGEGEVQEMIDMCDFAVGLSRQLYGLTIATERASHRMMEQWHPLGPVGVITAFNFPVAVWAWNAALAAVCGDTVIWKPSNRTPLTALAVQKIVNKVMAPEGWSGVFSLCIGDSIEAGQWMAADSRLPLVSATGSTAMGKSVGEVIAKRLGRSLLELGGNNAVILTETANLDMALRGCVFAAVGTAGQRCTTLRRLFLQEKIADDFQARLVKAYSTLKIGAPWEEGTLVGPLISPDAVDKFDAALRAAKAQGGKILCGGKRLDRPGNFVEPTIVLAKPDMPITKEETFAPILYVMRYETLDDAIAHNNDVPQGLSSAIFTDSLTQAETFLSAAGSDCGIANVNIGTSGAEIGGAFGGEKETGGGREAGSDAWKTYMRRQTCTVNFGKTLPLAQGVRFEI